MKPEPLKDRRSSPGFESRSPVVQAGLDSAAFGALGTSLRFSWLWSSGGALGTGAPTIATGHGDTERKTASLQKSQSPETLVGH